MEKDIVWLFRCRGSRGFRTLVYSRCCYPVILRHEVVVL